MRFPVNMLYHNPIRALKWTRKHIRSWFCDQPGLSPVKVGSLTHEAIASFGRYGQVASVFVAAGHMYLLIKGPCERWLFTDATRIIDPADLGSERLYLAIEALIDECLMHLRGARRQYGWLALINRLPSHLSQMKHLWTPVTAQVMPCIATELPDLIPRIENEDYFVVVRSSTEHMPIRLSIIDENTESTVAHTTDEAGIALEALITRSISIKLHDTMINRRQSNHLVFAPASRAQRYSEPMPVGLEAMRVRARSAVGGHQVFEMVA